MNKNPELLLVSNEDKYFIYCIQKQVVIENINVAKKQETPSIVKLSHDDKYVLEVYD